MKAGFVHEWKEVGGAVMLCLILSVLKLVGVIGCKWLWVWAPLWIPLGVGIAAFTFIAAIFLLIVILDWILES